MKGNHDTAARRPNIVFIMADDMGYGDPGCYNADSLIPTPHIDRVAAEGVRFTDAHAPAAVCTPTRYGVLTGRYCWRTWLGRGVVGGYTGPLIEPDRATLPGMLRQCGYRTACVGKWHLGVGWTRANGLVGSARNAEQHFRGSWQDGDAGEGMNVDFTRPVVGGPLDVGFDTAYFTSACSTMDGPFAFIENDRTVGLPDKPIFVDETRAAEYFRPRAGWIANGYVLETVDLVFADKAAQFIHDAARTPERPFFLYFTPSAPHTPWLVPTFMQGRSGDGPRGDLVALYDWCVGRVMTALAETGLAENTLVIVTSDHGPHEGTGGHRSAGALRGLKSHTWEGGHRVPFVARWPGRIAPGRVESEPICHTDVMAACAAVVGAALGEEAAPDSVNVLPALLGEPRQAPLREAVVSHSVYGVLAIRRGAWKLIVENQDSGGWVPPAGTGPEAGGDGQLYDLENDPGEENDLFAERPDVVAALTDLLASYRRNPRSVPAG